MAPAGTPPDVIAKLNAAENAALKSRVTQRAIVKLGLKPQAMSPQALTAVLADEARLWKAVVQEAGVHFE